MNKQLIRWWHFNLQKIICASINNSRLKMSNKCIIKMIWICNNITKKLICLRIMYLMLIFLCFIFHWSNYQYLFSSPKRITLFFVIVRFWFKIDQISVQQLCIYKWYRYTLWLASCLITHARAYISEVLIILDLSTKPRVIAAFLKLWNMDHHTSLSLNIC